jgi:hypothetical protein
MVRKAGGRFVNQVTYVVEAARLKILSAYARGVNWPLGW